jgi:hypothetical protein
MQMAGVSGWWEIGREGRFGNQAQREPPAMGGVQPRVGQPGYPDGGQARGQRAGRRPDGLQREQRRLSQEQIRQQAQAQLADPARRLQMRQFASLADQVRAMPPQTYAQRRSELATQLYQSQNQVRAQTAAPEQTMDAFIDRTLLLPRAPIVLQERLEAMGA